MAKIRKKWVIWNSAETDVQLCNKRVYFAREKHDIEGWTPLFDNEAVLFSQNNQYFWMAKTDDIKFEISSSLENANWCVFAFLCSLGGNEEMG